MMTMTHTEKQFLYDIGEEEWTDTWFDILPEEVWQIIYRHVSAYTINTMVMYMSISFKKRFIHYPESCCSTNYDRDEFVNVIEKIPICGNELKKIRDNPPNKFIGETIRNEKMDYYELPPGCEKLPMKYITKSGQVYVFVSAIQTNRGANFGVVGGLEKVSITIEINYRELNGVKLRFIKKLEHKEMSKNKVSTLTLHRGPYCRYSQYGPVKSGLELRDSMEYLNKIHRGIHALNLERCELLRTTGSAALPHTKKIKLYKKKSGCLL
jgi:hypothetical protein